MNLKRKRNRMQGRKVCMYTCTCKIKGAAYAVGNKSSLTHKTPKLPSIEISQLICSSKSSDWFLYGGNFGL